MLALICPQTSAKLVGGYGTAVDHVLAMTFDAPTMDDDLRRAHQPHRQMRGREPLARRLVGADRNQRHDL